MKIHYENMCSLRNEDIEFEPGKLIAITGETNQGKSALFYGLVDGLTNSPNFKKYLNNQALKENPKAIEKIDIIDDNGDFWQVEAGTGHFHYRANKVKYEKVGRKNIFEITESKIPGLLYDPDNTEPIMNVLDEDSGMFPIDRSDAQIFKTYERLLSLSCTQDILRTIKLDQEDIDYKLSDLTKSIQQSQANIDKIDKACKEIDEDKLDKSIQTLETLLNDYNRLNDLVDKNAKIAEYSNKVLATNFTGSTIFDTENFKTLLSLLIKAQQDIKYISLSNQEVKSINAIDLNIISKVEQDYSKAITLDRELADLNQMMLSDGLSLKQINETLDKIEVCPFCGRPMGDNNDKAVHSC